MKSASMNLICRILVCTLMTLSFQSSHAGMILNDQAPATTIVDTDRTVVVNMLNRANTASQLQSLGVDHKTALDRVAAMTDEEVHSLAGQVNALPAGGDGLIALILVVFFVWYFAFRR